MFITVPLNSGELVARVRMATGWTQKELADIAGVSLRTVSRWATGGSAPGITEWRKLAVKVFAEDPALAAELATAGGATLEALGVVMPRPRQPVQDPPPPPAPPPLPASLLIEAVVCAAAEELDASPRAVRGSLRAAFRRAREMRLTVEAMDDALSAPKTKKKEA